MEEGRRERTVAPAVGAEAGIVLEVRLSDAKLTVGELLDVAPVAFRDRALDAVGRDAEAAGTRESQWKLSDESGNGTLTIVG